MSKEPEKGASNERPLDELLSLRGKSFADWKEEREYLRRKWGEQGKRVEPGPGMGEPADDLNETGSINKDS
ncbi:MAG: hypothetical protein HN494_00475 [Opitutae bacterium]|nr:hypothetical protein [Opitutae bacterium]MBT4667145.1 hypothetical protein [Opitutae bacterium]MBT5908929.1 hypothetical protein [Opitutae bacterium]MBT7743431.1 hypothetical protein [Opitutae bacterium]MBT7922946.1 hypothetical protein [Opitutae bacterium]